MELHDFVNFALPNRRTAYAASLIGGAAITFLWAEAVHFIIQWQFPGMARPLRLRWMPIAIGVLERAVMTSFAIWVPMALGPFMGTWIVAKAAGGWALVVTGEDHKRALYFAGLLGSIVSLGWALAWGLWAPPGHR